MIDLLELICVPSAKDKQVMKPCMSTTLEHFVLRDAQNS